jgi:hypothetical protein
MPKITAPDWAPDSDNTKKYNKYAPYDAAIDDSTVMVFGKYKGLKMVDVPASYLFWYAEQSTNVKNYWLMQYIFENFEVLKKEK